MKWAEVGFKADENVKNAFKKYYTRKNVETG